MAVTDFNTKASIDAGNKAREAIVGMLSTADGAGLGTRATANVVGALVASMTSIVLAAFSAVFRIATEVGTLFLEGFEQGRLSNQDATNGMAAALLSDLLGIEVDGADIPKGGNTGQQILRAEAIGGKLHDLLEVAFGGQAGADGNAGARAARAFSGFSISSAIGAAMIGILTELESLSFLKEWHHLGEDVLQSLGLGRLHRKAMGPLVDALIVKPYTRYMNAKYSPSRLSAGEVLTAMFAGRMDEAAALTHLKELGFSDELATEMRIQAQPKLTLQEVDTLVRWGSMTRPEAIQQLMLQGIPGDIAGRKLDALAFSQADGVVSAYANEIFSLARDRFIDAPTYTSLIDRLPMNDPSKQRWADKLGIALETPHKRLTVLELVYLLERNQITDADIHEWARGMGLSEDDAFRLQIYADMKDGEFDAKAKAAADKAAAAAAKAKAKAGGTPKAPPAVP